MFYMVEPGEEYFLHMSLWKNVPFGYKMDSKTESLDVTLTKQVEKRATKLDENEHCIDDESYNFIGKYILIILKYKKSRHNCQFNLLISQCRF